MAIPRKAQSCDTAAADPQLHHEGAACGPPLPSPRLDDDGGAVRDELG